MSKWRAILERHLPVLSWGAAYDGRTFANDLLVAAIVTIMLIPQSLAYAMVAGLPPEVGLYASMAPLVLYAVFGTSRTLAVGPVAVVSLMTAAAIGPLATENTPAYLGAAIALATLSGVLLLAMGLLRLGFLANFLSHQVIAGFITASALQIAAGQLAPLLGIPAKGHSFVELVLSLGRHVDQIHLPTAAIGLSSLGFLFWVRSRLQPLLRRAGLGDRSSDMLARMGPVAAIALAIGVVWGLALDARGVSVVGAIPRGLPGLALPALDTALWSQLLVPALLISIVGYVESISVAHTLAARRRQRIDPDQELIALGAANLGSAVSGGFPVTGGFARSVVNFEAGAETPAAGAFAAVGIALATLFLTPLLFYLPHATLAATIVVAVLSLVELGAFRRTYAYSPADAAAMAATIGVTLGWGVEPGLLAGVGLSLSLYLYRTSRPHMAVVGQVPGTQHFRNVERHTVVTAPAIVAIRVDESLCFPNARFFEDRVNELVAANPAARHVVLVCSAVNEIDASALESLEAVNARLRDGGIRFHLSEVKGPVMDRLQRSHFLRDLSGQIHLSQYDAIRSLDAELARNALEARRLDDPRTPESREWLASDSETTREPRRM